LNFILSKWSLVTWGVGVEKGVLEGKVDLQNGELSLDNDSVKTFFLWLVLINN